MKQFFRALSALAGLALLAPAALAQDSAEIARVQAGHDCRGCNLFQADLSYRDLEGVDLSGSRLRQADLSLSTLNRADLSRTDLSVSNLFGARFTGTSFAHADLTRANAVGAYFGGADLTGAVLDEAIVSGAEMETARGLTQAQLARACGDARTRLPAGLTVPFCR